MRSVLPLTLFIISMAAFLGGCGESAASGSDLPFVPVDQRVPVSSERITNLEAPVPAQCYTRTEDRFNPCYTCHQLYDRQTDDRMNELDDGSLQGGYMFSEEGETNHWRNLFEDRNDWLAKISDEQIVAYINKENYTDLAGRLSRRDWPGFIPDLENYHLGAEAFDENGLARDGSGWVAFNYKPFPGTFWPTNGSTDDVLIRLPKAFREDSGKPDDEVYLLNLSLLEMVIKQQERISIPPIDENTVKTDLDGNGELSSGVDTLAWRSHYMGDASDIGVAHQQYPEGTEFMHSVRYVGVAEDGGIHIPERMKELRYMRKIREIEPYDLKSRYARERKDKNLGLLPEFVDHREEGMENGLGWMLQGYIEDYDGALRPQTHEETRFCMGCHSAVGVTIDQTFAFARKVDGARGWGYIDTRGMPDAPNISEPNGEILNYLKRAGGGSEFRENPEMVSRWYNDDGSVNEAKVRSADVHALISPSPERALKLNKAYAHIVRHQSYIYGRDATWDPARNVFKEVDESEPPLPREFRFYHWDLRLDWSSAAGNKSIAELK